MNKDTYLILYNFLSIDDKYSFHKYSTKYFNDNISFTQNVIQEIKTMNRSGWAKICYTINNINHTFVDDHIDKIKWKVFSYITKLNNDFIIKYNNYLDLKAISHNHFLSEKIINMYSHKLCWDNLSLKQKFTLKQIKKYQNQINFFCLSYNKNLTIDIIRQYKDKLDWDIITETFMMDKNFINEFGELINYNLLDDLHSI